MLVSVVVPTTHGREHLVSQAIESLKATTPEGELELILVRDVDTVGGAWQMGAQQATGEYLLLGADDMVAHPGWLEAADRAAKRRHLPSPRLLLADGSLQNCGTMGGGMFLPDCPEGTLCVASPLPFIRRDLWDRVGPSPPIHYYSDDAISHQARLAGLECRVYPGFCFTHLEGKVGTQRVVERAMTDQQHFLSLVASA